MINKDIENFKFIDDDNNSYIIGALTNIDSERYALMVNIDDESDNFVAKLLSAENSLNLDIVEDEELVSKVLENLTVI